MIEAYLGVSCCVEEICKERRSVPRSLSTGILTLRNKIATQELDTSHYMLAEIRKFDGTTAEVCG